MHNGYLSISCLQALKRSGGRTADEDDEAVFMKEHAARMHTSIKPKNISVVGSSVSGAEIASSPPTGSSLPLQPNSLLPSTGKCLYSLN